LTEQSRSIARQVRKYGIAGITIHLVGFAVGFTSTALLGIFVLTPVSDLLYGLGLVMVVAVAGRAGVPMKFLVAAGAVIGIGLFYRGQDHGIHVASGIGFGIVHPAHIGLGHILMTISVAALVVLAFVYIKSRQRGDGK
jgi:hypothetical protein